MRKRLLLPVVLVVAALGLLGVACSSDDNSSESGSKTDVSGETSASTPASAPGGTDGSNTEDPSTEPVSDEDFATQMGALRASIESAGDNVCALSKALGSLPPDPTDADQTRQYTDTYVLMLHNIAAVLGPDTEFGAPVEDAANKFAERAEELDYSPTFIDDDKLFDIMNAEPVSMGLVQFGQLAATCPDAVG